jgi:hypothetical protein
MHRQHVTNQFVGPFVAGRSGLRVLNASESAFLREAVRLDRGAELGLDRIAHPDPRQLESFRASTTRRDGQTCKDQDDRRRRRPTYWPRCGYRMGNGSRFQSIVIISHHFFLGVRDVLHSFELVSSPPPRQRTELVEAIRQSRSLLLTRPPLEERLRRPRDVIKSFLGISESTGRHRAQPLARTLDAGDVRAQRLDQRRVLRVEHRLEIVLLEEEARLPVVGEA